MIGISRSHIKIVTSVAMIWLVCCPVPFIQHRIVITHDERTLRLLLSQIREDSHLDKEILPE